MAAAPALQVRGASARPVDAMAAGKSVSQGAEIGLSRDAAGNAAPGDPFQNVNFGTAAPAGFPVLGGGGCGLGAEVFAAVLGFGRTDACAFA